MDIMFRITFTCEDRNLATLMHGLAGQVYDLQVVPVAGSNPVIGNSPVNKPRGGQPGTRTPQLQRDDIIAAGGAAHMLVKIMRQHKLDTINAKTTKDLCRQMGLSTTSYSHLLATAVQQGLIRKAGKDPDGLGFLWKLTDNKGADK
jgi:hypothetical protein